MGPTPLGGYRLCLLKLSQVKEIMLELLKWHDMVVKEQTKERKLYPVYSVCTSLQSDSISSLLVAMGSPICTFYHNQLSFSFSWFTLFCSPGLRLLCYSYSTLDGSRRSESVALLPGGGHSVTGSWQFLGTDGATYRTHFTADARGYRPRWGG